MYHITPEDYKNWAISCAEGAHMKQDSSHKYGCTT
jgi:hypothetical protein